MVNVVKTNNANRYIHTLRQTNRQTQNSCGTMMILTLFIHFLPLFLLNIPFKVMYGHFSSVIA